MITIWLQSRSLGSKLNSMSLQMTLCIWWLCWQRYSLTPLPKRNYLTNNSVLRHMSVEKWYSLSHYIIIVKGNFKIWVYVHISAYACVHTFPSLYPASVYPANCTHEHVLHCFRAHGTSLQTEEVDLQVLW